MNMCVTFANLDPEVQSLLRVSHGYAVVLSVPALLRYRVVSLLDSITTM